MSVLFLGRRQHPFHLVGVTLVVVGITIVALSGFVSSTGEVKTMPSSMIMGISLCIFAQVFQASMFVYEEKIMSKYPVRPLQCVGMEGVFGLSIATTLLIAFEYLGYANSMG